MSKFRVIRFAPVAHIECAHFGINILSFQKTENFLESFIILARITFTGVLVKNGALGYHLT